MSVNIDGKLLKINQVRLLGPAFLEAFMEGVFFTLEQNEGTEDGFLQYGRGGKLCDDIESAWCFDTAAEAETFRNLNILSDFHVQRWTD